MIPYFEQPSFEVAGLTLHSFGIMVAIALLVGYLVLLRAARKRGYDANAVDSVFIWTVIPAYIGSHIFEVLVYHPGAVINDPLRILDITDGISSFGGLLSFLLAFYIYLRVSGKLATWREWSDIITEAFVVAWIFGRFGCTLAHDHPGLATDFFLAINFPEGPRHDLGFYEFLYTLLFLFPVSQWLKTKAHPAGMQMVVFIILYSPFRFLADFLRSVDVRYFGLTPGQYASVLLFLLGLVLLRHITKKRVES